MSRSFFAALAIVSMAPDIWAGCQGPVAVDDTAENYGSTLVVDVLANDTDADGEALAVSVLGTCAGADITVRGGMLQIEPANHQPSSCTFNYRITDESGLSADAQVQVNAQILGPLFADGFEPGSTAAWSLTCIAACSPEPESFGRGVR